MNDEKKWTKKGFEVHVSKDGKDWYRLPGDRSRRPMYAENELRIARADFKKAQANNHHVRLLKMRIDNELLDTSHTEVTDNERKDAIEKQARELFKGDAAVEVSQHSYIGFSASSIDMSPSYVNVKVKHAVLIGQPYPRSVDFRDENKRVDKAALKRAEETWIAKAKVYEPDKTQEIEAKLKEAGMAFRKCKEGPWTFFNLA